MLWQTKDLISLMNVLVDAYILQPPGRSGASQMTPSEINRTSAIAKVKVLVEQVIRRLKTFQTIANEMPISLLSQVNDILIVCSALCNSKEPLYND